MECGPATATATRRIRTARRTARTRTSDGICVTHECDADDTPSSGSTVFPETLTATSLNALGWTTAMDIRWCKGDLAGLSGYTTSGEGSVSGATSMDISMDNPAAGSGMYYMVREQGCGSWQTNLGDERARRAATAALTPGHPSAMAPVSRQTGFTGRSRRPKRSSSCPTG